MGKKIDEAYKTLLHESRQALQLAMERGETWDKGYAQGMTEALRIVTHLRG